MIKCVSAFHRELDIFEQNIENQELINFSTALENK